MGPIVNTIRAVPSHGTFSMGFPWESHSHGQAWVFHHLTDSELAGHRFHVSLELRWSGAVPRRWAPQLVTRFGVIRRV